MQAEYQACDPVEAVEAEAAVEPEVVEAVNVPVVELVNDLEAVNALVVGPANVLEGGSVPAVVVNALAVVAANVPVVDSVLAADKR